MELAYLLESPKSRCTERYIKSNFPEEYKKIYKLPGEKFSEKIYRYFHPNIQNKCIICGKPTKFKTITEGFSRTCCLQCAYKDPKRIKKIKQTCLEKYGDENYNNREKFQKTTQNMEYGFKKKSTHEKIKQKYGVDNISQLNDIKKQKEQTTLQHYGVSNILKLDSVRELGKRKLIEKYGGSYFGTDEFKLQRCIFEPDRIKKSIYTNIIKYGVYNYSKTDKFKLLMRMYANNKNINNYSELLYINPESIWICKCPHPECDKCVEKCYQTTYHIFYDRRRNNTELCTKLLPIGNPSKTSSYELQLKNLLDQYNIEYKSNIRDIISPKELDIYIPSKQIAIEINGCYWHSEEQKNSNYHINKFKECQSKGIQLLTIWEDWIVNKPNIVKSIILNKLGLTQNKIYARQCVIKEVQSKDTTKFLNENHIQGATKCSIKLGLYYNDELISLMCFNKRSKLSGSKNMIEGEYELIRFCNKLNMSVVGGASKLLKYFIKKYNPSIITSFSSNDISNGNLYKTLGFESDYNINKSYWYIEPTTMKRYHRTSFTRSSISEKFGYDINDKTWTERSVMDKMRYYRIYDSGTLRWKLELFH